METFLNFEELTIEEVTGRLKAIDDREEAPPTEKGEGTNASKERRRRPRGGKKGKAKADRDSECDG